MEFDLPGLDTKTLSETGTRLVLRRLDNDEPVLAKNGQPIALILQGPDSSTFRKAVRSQAVKRMTTDITKDFDEGKLDTIEAENLNTLVACTVGWENVLDAKGKEVEFDRKKVRQMYESFPTVREQAERFYANRKNFLLASPKT